jgi:hypothetical protein
MTMEAHCSLGPVRLTVWIARGFPVANPAVKFMVNS